MPLDRDNGEVIGSLGPHYHVVPTHKWTDSPFWEDAQKQAWLSFAKRARKLKTILPPKYFNPESVVVQEYRTQGRIVFIFQMNIKGTDYYHPVQIAFPPEAERELILMGRWRRETVQ